MNYFSSDESFCNHYITGPKYMHWRKKNVTSKVVKQVQIVVPNTAQPSPLLRIVFTVWVETPKWFFTQLRFQADTEQHSVSVVHVRLLFIPPVSFLQCVRVNLARQLDR